MAARSSGREWRSAPRGDLPTAVRRQSIITASRIGCPSLSRRGWRPNENVYLTRRKRRQRVLAATRPRALTSGFLVGWPASEMASSIPQRLAVLQHVLHAFLRLRVAAETQKRFPFQIQQILLRDALRAGEPSAAQHVCQLLADHAIVLGDVPAFGR